MPLVELLVLGLVAAVVAGVAHRRPAAQLLSLCALVVTLVFAVLFGLFVAGYAFEDPGGWTAVGLVAAWLVPMLVLAALAWAAPGPAVPVLGVVTGALVVMSLWRGLDLESWAVLRDVNGPVDAMAVFVAVVALGVLGRRRPAAAGTMLLVLGVVPVLALAVVGGVGAGALGGSLGAAATPAVLTGALYLAAAGLQRRTAAPTGRGPAGPGQAPTPPPGDRVGS